MKMNRFMWAVCASGLVAAFSAPAQADVWTDTVGYLDTNGTLPPGGFTPVLINTSSPYTFQHNILDSGYAPGAFTISSVDLDIWLADDSLKILGWDIDGSEKVSFSWDGSAWTSPKQVDGSVLCLFGCGWQQFDLDPTSSLLNDGVLSVSIRATEGDFYFKRSQLRVTGSPVSVPEPATLALFGLGLVGIGIARRRRTT